MFSTTQYLGSELLSETGGQIWPPVSYNMCVYTSATANGRGTCTMMHKGLF
jgi:hypothetical protein